MKVEICENCEKEIGKLEQAFIHNNHIVCEQCYKKLTTNSKNQKNPLEKTQVQTIEKTGKKFKAVQGSSN